MEGFIKKLSYYINNESIKVPFSLRCALKLFFSEMKVRKYSTIKFSSTEIELENKNIDENLINSLVDSKDRLFTSSLKIDENSILYSFTRNDLVKNPKRLINKMLNNFTSEAMGKQINLIINLLPNASILDKGEMIIEILHCFKQASNNLYNTEFDVGEYNISFEQVLANSVLGSWCTVNIKFSLNSTNSYDYTKNKAFLN